MKKTILLISMCSLSILSRAQVAVNTGTPLIEDRNITNAASGSSDVGMIKDLSGLGGIRLEKGDSVFVTALVGRLT